MQNCLSGNVSYAMNEARRSDLLVALLSTALAAEAGAKIRYENFQCFRLSNFLDSRSGVVGKRGALGGLFNLIVTELVVETRPADLEELGGLCTIAPCLLQLPHIARP